MISEATFDSIYVWDRKYMSDNIRPERVWKWAHALELSFLNIFTSKPDWSDVWLLSKGLFGLNFLVLKRHQSLRSQCTNSDYGLWFFFVFFTHLRSVTAVFGQWSEKCRRYTFNLNQNVVLWCHLSPSQFPLDHETGAHILGYQESTSTTPRAICTCFVSWPVWVIRGGCYLLALNTSQL